VGIWWRGARLKGLALVVALGTEKAERDKD